MPKMKTHKPTAKRFKITRRGKILRGRSETKRRKMRKGALRELRVPGKVRTRGERRRIRRAAPYL